MTEQTELKATGNDSSRGGETALEKRRRLLRAGLGAAPVLMSLSSRSVFASKTTRPSGFCSMKIGTSSPGGGKQVCNGKPPETWCQQAQQVNHGWPTRCYPKTRKTPTPETATKCGDLFGHGTQHATKKCLDVMAGTAGTDEFAKWCVAARLNARAGLTGSVCTESDVQAMWSGCNSIGYYEPTAGQKWTKADCVSYLKSTCA